MKNITKELIKNYAVYLLLLVFFGIVSYFLFKLPYTGKVILERKDDFLFGTTVYKMIPTIYYLSPLLFCTIFLGLWYGVLNKKLNKIRNTTKIGYWIGLIFFILFLVLESFVYVFAIFTTFGFGSIELDNVHFEVDVIPFVFMFLTVLISTFCTLKRGAK